MGARAGLRVLDRPHCDGPGGACRNRGASDRGGRRCDPIGRRLPPRRGGILRPDDRGRSKTGRSRCAPYVRSPGSPASRGRVAGGNTFMTLTGGRRAGRRLRVSQYAGRRYGSGRASRTPASETRCPGVAGQSARACPQKARARPDRVQPLVLTRQSSPAARPPLLPAEPSPAEDAVHVSGLESRAWRSTTKHPPSATISPQLMHATGGASGFRERAGAGRSAWRLRARREAPMRRCSVRAAVQAVRR